MCKYAQVDGKCADLGCVHLVDGDDELTYTEGESQESVLSGLSILGDTSLKLTSTGGNDENSAIGLGGTSDHVWKKQASGAISTRLSSISCG
jgi:hypothetical protein